MDHFRALPATYDGFDALPLLEKSVPIAVRVLSDREVCALMMSYDIPPGGILSHRGEWVAESREMRTGDVIVQRAHPPAPGSILPGVRSESS